MIQTPETLRDDLGLGSLEDPYALLKMARLCRLRGQKDLSDELYAQLVESLHKDDAEDLVRASGTAKP